MPREDVVVGATDPVKDMQTAAKAIEGLLDADGHVTDGRRSRALNEQGSPTDDKAARAAAQRRDDRGKFRRQAEETGDEIDDGEPRNRRLERRRARQDDQNLDDRADDDQADLETDDDDVDVDEDDEADADADDRDTSEGDEAGEESGETESVETLEQLAEALEMEPEELLATLRAKFKAAGEDVEVTLSELIKGYQKDADYRRSTARLADERRAFENQARQRNDAYVRVQHVAASQLQLAEQLFSAQLNSPQLAALRDSDPAEWAARRDELGRMVQFIQQKRNEAATAYDQWRNQQLGELREREMKALAEAVPDWGENHRVAARTAMESLGFDADEIGQIFDSRLIRGALELHSLRDENKRLKERIAKAEQAAKRVKRDVPKFQKPGKGNKGGKQVRRDNLSKLKGRLRQSGDVRDAAKIIETML